jgi:hypothetical protein
MPTHIGHGDGHHTNRAGHRSCQPTERAHPVRERARLLRKWRPKLNKPDDQKYDG